ncbi:hypothetical protein Q8G13_27810, partial [Klebsiella pneumoniae]|nr:hypothetical protein [Klebsiella pneumoniae]
MAFFDAAQMIAAEALVTVARGVDGVAGPLFFLSLGAGQRGARRGGVLGPRCARSRFPARWDIPIST